MSIDLIKHAGRILADRGPTARIGSTDILTLPYHQCTVIWPDSAQESHDSDIRMVSNAEWTVTLDAAIANADRIIRDNNLMLVSAPRAHQLSELAGGDLTRAEATAWDYLLNLD